MAKVTVFVVLGVTAPFVVACEGEKKPPKLVKVSYDVTTQGTSSVILEGEVSKTIQGECVLSDSDDPTYKKQFTLNLSYGRDAIQLIGVKMRDGEPVPTESLPCTSAYFEHKDIYSDPNVKCGSVDDGKCEVYVKSYNREKDEVTGTFRCGEFRTSILNPPIVMSISDGNFTFTNCSRM